jgi:CBS domain-containing protein
MLLTPHERRCRLDGTLDARLREIARFLALREPFDILAPQEVGEVAGQTEIEFYPAGQVILSEDWGPVTFLRVIHSGAVDVIHEDRLLDLLGPGDTFGHAAMLSGLPPGFQARAAEDTLCYRLPVAVARPLLERARNRDLQVGLHEPTHRPVVDLIRTPTLRCKPAQSTSEVARQMTELGANAAIVELAGGEIGIVTDRDLRTRVLAAGLAPDAPVSEVMSTPVFSVGPERLGGEVLFEMLQRGIHHAPVISGRGQLVGVVEDADLFAAHRSWFGARRAIARAPNLDALADAADGLPKVMLELHASSMHALEIARVLSVLHDALISRALELALAQGQRHDDGLVWVAVGSHARRELTPGSITRGAFVYSAPPASGTLAPVGEALARCGLAVPPVARATSEWASASDAGDLRLGVLFDRRPVWGTPQDPLPVVSGSMRGGLLEELRRRVLRHVLPTGFEANVVLGPDGARSRRLDLRETAILPIAELACWAGALAGASEGSTLERLEAAAREGILSEPSAGTLADAFQMAFELRLRHHMRQIAAGHAPDDLLDPAELSPLTRSHLREVFRAMSAVQREHRG